MNQIVLGDSRTLAGRRQPLLGSIIDALTAVRDGSVAAADCCCGRSSGRDDSRPFPLRRSSSSAAGLALFLDFHPLLEAQDKISTVSATLCLGETGDLGCVGSAAVCCASRELAEKKPSFRDGRNKNAMMVVGNPKNT